MNMAGFKRKLAAICGSTALVALAFGGRLGTAASSDAGPAGPVAPAPNVAVLPPTTAPSAGGGAVNAGKLLPVIPPIPVPVPPSPLNPPNPLAKLYTNPLPIRGADPFVMYTGGKFYLYATSAGNGFRVWSSEDLVSWTAHELCYQRTPTSWGRRKFWAPEVVQKDGKFLLHYAAEGILNGKETLRICVAQSSSPLGPFTDVAAPMVDFGKAMIDPHVFRDQDGKAYLYYALDCSENRTAAGKPISEIYVLPLNSDLISVAKDAKPTFVSRPDQEWEGTQWNEGPEVFRKGDTYVMMYSGNYFGDRKYGIGYQTAKSPLGPWTKAREPVLKANEYVSGPGHNSIVSAPDGTLWCVYHRHETAAGGGRRVICIDPMEVLTDAAGMVKLIVHGPTTRATAFPAAAAPAATPSPLPSAPPTTRPMRLQTATVAEPVK